MTDHNPGGKVMLPLPPGTTGNAVFGGAHNEYRYRLERVWNEKLPTVMFVMMNPSTADPLFDDPTVAKCGRYARAWGYGRLLVGNTFAYRATDQRQLCAIDDPLDAENISWLGSMASIADCIVFAYGLPHKSLRNRAKLIVAHLRGSFPEKSHYLQLCADGTPSHPLYLKGNLTPTRWDR